MQPATTLIIAAAGAVLSLALLGPRLPVYLAAAGFSVLSVFLCGALRHPQQGLSPVLRQRRALRPLRFTATDTWEAEQDTSTRGPSGPRLASSQLIAAFDRLLGLIVHHFILPWYIRISPSPAFPNAVDILVRGAVEEAVVRMEKVDWPSVMVSKVLPLITDHLHHYRSVEHLSSTAPTFPALPLPLPINPHPALSSRAHLSSSLAVEDHFRQMLDRILHQLIDEKDQSPVTMTVLREMLLGAVVVPMYDMLCEEDFWNRQIDERVGRYLHEQKQVDKFLSALSRLPISTASAANSPARPKQKQKPNSIGADSTSAQFDVFLRSIKKLRTLGEARRLRADVERELRSAKLALVDQLKMAGKTYKDGETLRKTKKYVERLERAKTDIDARVAILSGRKAPSIDHTTETALDPATTHSISLYSILSDPSSLAYWLEYMERRHRSRLVQYWLTVEGFKDPLEAAGINSAPESTRDDTTLDDVKFLYGTYLCTDPASSVAIVISPRYLSVIAIAAQSEGSLQPEDSRKVKQAVYASQKEVYEQMEEEDWESFRKGELFIKAVHDLRQSNIAPPPLHTPQLTNVPLSSSGDPYERLSLSPSPRPDLLPLQTPIARPTTTSTQRPSLTPDSKSFLSLLTPSSRSRKSTPPTVITKAGAEVSFCDVRVVSPPPFGRSFSDFQKENEKKETRRATAADAGFSDPHRSPSLISSPTFTSSPTLAHPSPPPPSAQRSSQLDFLIGPTETTDEELSTRNKLFGDEPEDVEDEEVRRMEAIQAALSEIIRDDDVGRRATACEGDDGNVERGNEEMSNSMILPAVPRQHQVVPDRKKSKSVENLKSPTTIITRTHANRSLSDKNKKADVAKKSSRLLFDDDLPEDDSLSQDSAEEEEDLPVRDTLQFSAPGDLHLFLPISLLQTKLVELSQQDSLLDSLIGQAELTGNQKELKILRRSRASVNREMRAKKWQKEEYERQEAENRLVTGRTRVSIPTAVVVDDPESLSAPTVGLGPKQIVRYNISVSQVEEGKVTLGWMVSRRYNEFWELDRGLRESVGGGGKVAAGDLLRKVEIPGKRLVGGVNAGFVESRRVALESYLQALLASQTICDSPQLRSFLSRLPTTSISAPSPSPAVPLSSLAPHNIVKSIYKTLSSGGLDDSFVSSLSGLPGIGAPNMVDIMYSGLSRQFNDFGGLVGLGLGVGAAVESVATEGEGMTSFTAPICDLFIEVFGLKEKDWFRRQAVVVILQQFLGGAVERKVRESFRTATSPDSFINLLSNLQETLFPEGNRRPPSTPRTEEEKTETRLRAGKKFGLVIPDLAANMMGRGNARRAARRVFGALQDSRLNQQLTLCILDAIIDAMIPPAVPQK